MFDLDRAIAEWRTAFERDAAFARHEIDELEAHLRDSVAERIAAGEQLADAFAAVQAALGTPTALRPDFQQFDVWGKGWPALLQAVSRAGLILYAALFIVYMITALFGGLEEFWTIYAEGPLAPALATVLVVLNLGICIGFAGVMFYQGSTILQRAGAIISLASLGFAGYLLAQEQVAFTLNASGWIWDPTGVTGILGSLTFLVSTNGLTMLGLVALGIQFRAQEKVYRSIYILGNILALWQGGQLQYALDDFAWNGAPYAVLVLATLAYTMLSTVAWNRWVRRPAQPKWA